MAERPTFSAFWHRVRGMKPRLRPHVQITRQRYRGRIWHVVHDPSSNLFYRLNPVAHDFVCLLDGARSVEEAWKESLARFGDMAPTQNEVLELLSQLYNSNLLSTDASPETEQLLRRGQDRTKRRIAQQAIGLMYLRIKLFNPDRILTAVEPFFRPVLNRWGLLVWALFVGYTLTQLLSSPKLGEITAGFDLVSNPGNWGWLLAVFIALKLWHELGHGVICKRFGGQVPEFGVMLLVLFPSPFVDASACWAFPSKWKRMAVGAGGMMFELTVAAVATWVWLEAPEGSLLKHVAYFTMFTSGVSTILFNANPLMKFDGYYMLADLLEVPNLMQRSATMLNYLFQRYVFRLTNARSPGALPGERTILVVFGVLSMVYRVLVFLAVTLYVLGLWFIVGVILACWTAGAWFILPIGKLARWLATSSLTSEHRGRTIATTLGLAAAGLVLIGMVPLPDWRRGMGVVYTQTDSVIFAGTDGFVAEVFVRPGDVMRKGDAVMRLESPELSATLRDLAAKREEARVAEHEALTSDNAIAAEVAVKQQGVIDEQIVAIKERQERLVVRSPQDGTIVGRDPALLAGAYLKQGEPITAIVDRSRLRIAASMSQAEASWLFELPEGAYTVEARLVSEPSKVLEGIKVRAIPAGQRDLTHPALGYLGGGEVETEAEDRQGRVARKDRFTVYVEVAPEAIGDAPLGQRVYLRFTLPNKSIMSQVIDRVQKTLQGRVNL